MKTEQEYRDTVSQEFENWYSSNRVPLSQDEVAHVKSIGFSVLQTRDGGILGGSFVRAIVDNDLSGALSRADLTNKKVIPFYVHLKDHVRIY
jgi:hypothetical protein